ncbi:MAG: hypothetical protein EBZ61_09380 [Micrococcales bacterium]|nr:hypothetical protein [Micrococcales bacterium]
MSRDTCFSFHPGHNLHFTKIDSFNQPRNLVDISHVVDTAFLVTVNGVTDFWYHHNPDRLISALESSMPEGIEVTEDKKFLFVYTGELVERFNMAQEQFSSCIRITEKISKKPEVVAIIKSLHAENIKKLIERGISA